MDSSELPVEEKVSPELGLCSLHSLELIDFLFHIQGARLCSPFLQVLPEAAVYGFSGSDVALKDRKHC